MDDDSACLRDDEHPVVSLCFPRGDKAGLASIPRDKHGGRPATARCSPGLDLDDVLCSVAYRPSRLDDLVAVRRSKRWASWVPGQVARVYSIEGEEGDRFSVGKYDSPAFAERGGREGDCAP
jgi:hypothetical protein